MLFLRMIWEFTATIINEMSNNDTNVPGMFTEIIG